ncbi:MAG: hypothetical protein LBT14_14510 [Treponema sp.]|jgi:hypothetical protein|nr:hypothetical protein [Treponema sp.]
MKKGMILFFFIATIATAKEITLCFDFTSIKNDTLAARVKVLGKEIIVKSGRSESLNVEYDKKSFYTVTYFDMSSPDKEAYGTMNALPAPSNANTLTVSIPAPKEHPSGDAKVRFLTKFPVPLEIYLVNEGYERRKIGRIWQEQEFETTIRAGSYKLEIRNPYNPKEVLRGYDKFYFPAAFNRYDIEFAPDEKKPRAAFEPIYEKLNDKGDSSNFLDVPLDASFDISFDKQMIEPIVEANLNFALKDNPREKIPVQALWDSTGTKLQIKPFRLLNPKHHTLSLLILIPAIFKEIRYLSPKTGYSPPAIEHPRFRLFTGYPHILKITSLFSNGRG